MSAAVAPSPPLAPGRLPTPPGIVVFLFKVGPEPKPPSFSNQRAVSPGVHISRSPSPSMSANITPSGFTSEVPESRSEPLKAQFAPPFVFR